MTREDCIQLVTTENPFLSNQDLIYEVLIRELLTHTLKKGEMLTQGKLSSDFHLSRGPVKQALEKLTREHFLRKDTAGVYYVNQPDVHLTANVFAFKKQLDYLATRQAVYRITKGHLERLNELLQAFQEAFAARDYVTFCRYDLQFHLVIVKASNNFLVEETYIRHQNLFQFISSSVEEAMDEPLFRRLVHQHHKIFTALKNRQHDAIGTLIDSHYSSLIPM